MRASVDGFSTQVFHQKCDNKGPTLTVIKANDRVFGGFTNLSWVSAGGTKSGDPNAFVFRVVNIQDEDNSSIEKFNHNKDGVIWCGNNYCAVFGSNNGHDINIHNNCNQVNSHAKLGASYKLPQGIDEGSEVARSHLAGAREFTVQDYEVFQVLAP